MTHGAKPPDHPMQTSQRLGSCPVRLGNKGMQRLSVCGHHVQLLHRHRMYKHHAAGLSENAL